MSQTPPQIAKDTYAMISQLTSNTDPVAKAKEIATKMALDIDVSFASSLSDFIKLSAIGNVIDFGAQKQLDLNSLIQQQFHKDFALNDYEKFINDLQNAKSMVYIGDNTGEHIFDKLLISKIKELYDIEIYYFTRGKPIINDITTKEASHLADVATIIDTGVSTPGFDLQYANEKSKEIFYSSDIVLAKGMGNYESLYDETTKEIYYLFIVKCSVVAQAIGQNIGEYIFTKH
jgi:uncharacterized protein with ATP-grasp and redox domains